MSILSPNQNATSWPCSTLLIALYCFSLALGLGSTMFGALTLLYYPIQMVAFCYGLTLLVLSALTVIWICLLLASNNMGSNRLRRAWSHLISYILITGLFLLLGCAFAGAASVQCGPWGREEGIEPHWCGLAVGATTIAFLLCVTACLTFVLIYLGQPNTAINIELGETSTIGSAPGARDMTFLELEFDRNHNDLAGLPKAGLDREDSSPMQQLYTTRAIDPLYIS